MLKQTLKRLFPQTAHRPLRRAYEAARDSLLRPVTLRQAAQVRSRLDGQVAGQPTVVFFAPEASVTLYLQTQAALARILRARGCNTVFVRCFELLPRCPVKDMLLLPFDASPAREQLACLQCYRDSVRQLDGFGLDFLDLREVIDEAARRRIEAAMARLPGGGLDFDYDGINVGALAFYDFAISHKHPASEPMSAAGRAAWAKYVGNAITAIEMTRGLAERFSPVTLACFDEYAMMSAARLYAKRRNIQVRMVSIAYHLNGDPRRPVAMSNLTVVKDFEWRKSQWKKWRETPLTPALVAAAADDVVYRLTRSGTHIYSPNKTLDTAGLRASLRLDPARRVLVAYTSSRDEHDALLVNLRGLGIEPPAVDDAFGDTFEWLHALIGHVEASPDLQLVVRVHPRVGVTSRDNRVAAEYARYRKEFSADYRHCRFVWPEDPVSSFDLAEFADLALVSWSSIAMELARLGVPVLTGNRSVLVIGPEEEAFIEHAHTREQYFRSLARMTSGLPDPGEQLRLCFRWYHLFNLANSIDLGDVIGEQGEIGSVETAQHASLVRSILVDGTEALDANMASLEASVAPDSKREELEALQGQAGRLIEFICTGGDPAQTPALRLCDHASMRSPQQRGRLSVEGDEVIYDDGHRLWKRRSKMAARLGRICAALAADR